MTGYQLSEVKKAQTDLDIREGQARLVELNQQKASTDAAVDAAQKRLGDIQRELTGLRASVQEAQRSRPNGNESLEAAITSAASIQSAVTATTAQLNAVERARSAAPKPADLLVGVQTLGATDAERLDLNMKLSAAGYGLHELSASYETRPSWHQHRRSFTTATRRNPRRRPSRKN